MAHDGDNLREKSDVDIDRYIKEGKGHTGVQFYKKLLEEPRCEVGLKH
jgi:hypothetical protein